MASSSLPVRAKSAYFIFTESNREAAKSHLISNLGPDAKVSVADVAKELGQRWKALSEEERGVYKEKAAACKAAADEARAAAIAAGGADGDDAAAEQEAPVPTGPVIQLPLSLVKRIALCDRDVSRISHDALLVIAAAAEKFLELMAEKCAATASHAKPRRRTVKVDDVEVVVRGDRRLVTAGLKDVVAAVRDDAAARDGAEGEADGGQQGAGSPGGEQEDGGEKLEWGKTNKGGEGGPRAKRPRSGPGPGKAMAGVGRPITAFFSRLEQPPQVLE